MRALAITDIGVEWAVQKEVKEILGVSSSSDETVVKFKVKDLKQIEKFNSKTRASRRVLLYIGDYNLKNFDCVCSDSEKILKKFDFKKWFSKKTTFKVECNRTGEHDFTSKDVEEELGGIIIDNVEKLGFTPKVSLKKPDVIIYCHIQDKKSYIGIDFSKKDLSKRDYKVYTGRSSIRGNIAYSLVRFGDYEKGKVLLDPFVGCGIIPIEAALWNSGKIYGFDGVMRNIRYSQNNAKIADVKITFSKTSVDYLDTKFKEGEVDLIVTFPPQSSKHISIEDVKKVYDELLYQAKYVLNKKGTIVVLMRKTKGFLAIAKKHGFQLKKKNEIITGEVKYQVLKLRSTT